MVSSCIQIINLYLHINIYIYIYTIRMYIMNPNLQISDFNYNSQLAVALLSYYLTANPVILLDS